MKSGLLLAVVPLLLAAACTGGDTPGSDGAVTTPDGGGVPADVRGPASDARPDASPDGCPPAPVMVLTAQAWNLSLTGDDLVFVDLEAGGTYLAQKSRSIRKVKRDGTGDATLYTAAMDHQIKDAVASGTTVYFLENDRTNPLAEVTRVLSLPLAGGQPTLVVVHNDPAPATADLLDAIVAIEGGFLYAVRGGSGAISKLWRIPAAGGAGTEVFAGGIASRPQLQAGEFYFRDSTQVIMGSPGIYRLGKVSAAGSGGTSAAVGMAAIRGDLVVGAFGMIGTGAMEAGGMSVNVSRWDLTGGMHRQIFQYPVASRVAALGPADATSVIIHSEISVPTNSSAPFYKVPLAGGAATVVACERQQVRQRSAYESGGTHSAVVSQMDMVASGTELFWIERRGTSGAASVTHAIYRTAR